MTDIEEKLAAILTAEADRHEAPVFSAHRIADNAVRKGFWRQRKVLAIAAIGLAGLGGAGGAMVAAGHGDPRVTVTFQREPLGSGYMPPPLSAKPDVMRAWIQARVRADGLKDVDVTVRQDPFALVVTGRSSDTARLRMLGMPDDLLMAEMRSDLLESDDHKTPPSQCVEKSDIGPVTQLCDQNGHSYTFSVMSADPRLTVAHAVAVRRGPGVRDWAIVIQLDAASTERYHAFTADRAPDHERILLQAGVISLSEPTLTGPVADGVIESAAAFTEQQAKDLAVNLASPEPAGYDGLVSVTVTPAGSSR